MEYEVWKPLFDVAQKFMKLKPWKILWSSDLICMELAPGDLVYVAVMGKLGDCIGISFYEGDEGYADLCSINLYGGGEELVTYIMFEQTATTWYIGDEDEVPDEQNEAMEHLGLHFKKHQWPYFLRFEPMFSPSSLNKQEIQRAVQIYTVLWDVLKKYKEEAYLDGFEDQMMYVYQNEGNWEYTFKDSLEPVDKFSPVTLEDEHIIEALKLQKSGANSLLIDLTYINSKMRDAMYDKPVNILLFIVMDAETGMILKGDLLKPGDDERSAVMEYVITYIEENGIPRSIFFRNPMVYSAIVDLCEECQIDVSVDELEEVDEVIAQMIEMFDEGNLKM